MPGFVDPWGVLHPLASCEPVQARGGDYFLITFPNGRGQCMIRERLAFV